MINRLDYGLGQPAAAKSGQKQPGLEVSSLDRTDVTLRQDRCLLLRQERCLLLRQRQMSTGKTGRCPVSPFYICLVSAEDICPVSTADICPVSTEDIYPVLTEDILPPSNRCRLAAGSHPVFCVGINATFNYFIKLKKNRNGQKS